MLKAWLTLRAAWESKGVVFATTGLFMFLLLNAFLLFELAVELPLLNLNIVDFVIFFYLNWR